MQDNEPDIITIVDDNGDERTLEVEQYFYYEGEEYAILTDYVEHECSDEEECDECCSCCHECEEDGEEMVAYIMRVVPVDDDSEEFVPIEPEKMDDIIKFVQEELYVDDDLDDEEEEYMDAEEPEEDK